MNFSALYISIQMGRGQHFSVILIYTKYLSDWGRKSEFMYIFYVIQNTTDKAQHIRIDTIILGNRQRKLHTVTRN